MAIKFTIRIAKRRKPLRPQYAEISQVQKVKRPLRKRILKTAFFLILFSSACIMGVVLGTFLAVSRNLPSISELEEFEPNIITYIFADDGTVIGEYALEKRIEVPLEVIPETLLNAIIATEDARFFRHSGIDWRGILRALREDIEIIVFKRRGKFHGGSTISQQLATMLFLHRRQTLRRKFKEAILSLQIEKTYTKRQILNMYCNQFNLANGAWGVEAASQLYFDKTVSELTLEEAALIAGIPRGPTIYDPYKYPENALERRNHVFDRMVAEGYLSRAEAEEAKTKPLGVLPLHRETSEFAAYFREEVRRYLMENYGDAALYRLSEIC